MDDDLWELVEPLLPPWPEKAPGPRPVVDRLCLQGILYVLYNDIAWQLLPWSWGSAPDRSAGGAWTAGGRPGSSTSCTASCSPNSTRPADSTGPARAWTAPTSARKKGEPTPVRRRSTGGKRAANSI
ncbi:transposase [Streptomyces griseoviridis]